MTINRLTIQCLLVAALSLDGKVAQAATLGFLANELLGRPTDQSVTVHAVANKAVEAYVEYGTSSGAYSKSTATLTFTDGVINALVPGLTANTRYYYRLRYRDKSIGGAWLAGTQGVFQTKRSAQSTFTFTVQSDSHQGYASFYNAALYTVALQNQLADAPDFLFDLGDTVSLDGITENMQTVRQKYLNQRTYLDIVGKSAAVFLVLGNHENEEGWNLDDMGNNRAASLPVLGANARKRYFVNPIPDAFYSGNTDASVTEITGDHLKGDYYAFEWGDALFVAIDPFWYTMKKPFAGTLGGEKDDEVVGNRWDWTLGDQQYQWLRQTLEQSSAKYKFVFAHQLPGGLDDYGRGGALGAAYGEWGGNNTDGTWGFGTKRPTWEQPIHQLMVENGVTIFFHGHDHIFAKEALDGIVYQECPHAANSGYGAGFATNQQDYADGVLVNNSGHLRVTVSPAQVTVAYVRAYLPGDGVNRSVAHSYSIAAP